MRLIITALCLSTLSSLALAQKAENTWFNEKGEMGSTVIEQSGPFEISSQTFLAWNNRRYSREEQLVLDTAGIPQKVSIKGVSAFGAPIDEALERRDGQYHWQTTRDQGQSSEGGFYIGADMGYASYVSLINAIASSPSGEVQLLPSGTATARVVATKTIQAGELQQKVSLYAIEGLNPMPKYLWVDSDGMPFASGYPSRGMIRKAFGKQGLKLLSETLVEAEAAHLARMTDRVANNYDSLLIRNVRALDVEAGTLLPPGNVLLKHGKIAALGEDADAVEAALEVDGKGHTLVPGLWDMHGHLNSESGVMYLGTGVTSVRDLGTAHDRIMEIQGSFESGDVIGPNVYRSGFMDQFSEYSSGLSVKSLDEALNTVDWFADQGYLQVKLYSSISPEWVASISARAHKRGMRVSGHIPAFMNAEQAVDAGFDEIQHINMLFLTFLGGEKVDTRKQLRFSIPGEFAHTVDLDGAEVQAFIDKLVANNVVVDPTLSVFRTMYLRREGTVDPEYADIVDHLPPRFMRENFTGAEMELTAEQDPLYRKSAEALSQMVARLHQAGVWIVPGTDHWGLGLTLQRELYDYVEAGIPAADALRLATLDSARLVGAAHKTGSIEVGKDADLLLIKGNPLEDMRDLRRSVLVLKGDRYFHTSDLLKAVSIKPFAGAVEVTSNN